MGYEVQGPPEGFASWADWCVANGMPPQEADDGASVVDPEGVGPIISLRRVPERRSEVKNRLHLEVQVGGGRATPCEQRWQRVTETVSRLTEAGATVVAEHEWQGRPDHMVMTDQEGNEFYLV